MSILQTVNSFEFDKNEKHLFGLKSAIIWGHYNSGSAPLAYISKPKHVSDEDFKEILNNLHIMLTKPQEVQP